MFIISATSKEYLDVKVVHILVPNKFDISRPKTVTTKITIYMCIDHPDHFTVNYLIVTGKELF